MEGDPDREEGLPEMETMEAKSEHLLTEKMFTAKDLPEIERVFQMVDADGGGGLDMEEWCEGMKGLINTNVDLKVLHMKIDANCDGTVDFCEFTDYLLQKDSASQKSDYKNQVFPKPIKVIPVDHYKEIVGVIFRPFENYQKPDTISQVSTERPRTYQKGQYITISSDAILNFWTDSFHNPIQIPLNKIEKPSPFSHNKKMHVTDMVFIRDLKQLAISTDDRELRFYNCPELPRLFFISHSVIVEDSIVSAMNYWSNGTKAVFSFGDVMGCLSVFISYDIKTNGLFCRDVYEKISLQNYPTVYDSALFKNTSKDFLCVKVNIFDEVCSQIRYLPSLSTFAICGSSSEKMVLTHLPKTATSKLPKKVFQSSGQKAFFTCVEYSPSAGHLLTGGTDGIVRAWFPHKSTACRHVLEGHVKPITHILLNPNEKCFVSLSEDMHVRVWSDDTMQCMQSFQIQKMTGGPIASVCYNTDNNEIVLANKNIGKYLGRGTDVFHDTITSHEQPLCSVLFHNIYQQVISACQDGMVKVWDVLTGEDVVQFKVTPDGHVGHIAIALDEPQRRLITASLGKLKLWNFNNATELAVLPVDIPRDVTAIVCRNDRVFVSGRNSKIIYDLDIEGYDNRYLEHDDLNDISSMDIHEDRLVAASSDGNIVIWDVDNGRVIYQLNGSKSPRIHMVCKEPQGRTGSLPVDKKPKNVRGTGKSPLHRKPLKTGPLIKCLKTREINDATVLIHVDGYIEAWSVNSKGGLLAKFKPLNDDGAVITTMSTDVNEQTLLTGDSTGKFCLWDIKEFGFKKQASKGPFENRNNWYVSLSTPPLLRSWKSNITGLVSIECDATSENFIAAAGCNIRLWSNTGSHVGLFGKDKWGALQPVLEKTANQEEAGTPDTAKMSNFQMPFPESLRAASPEEQIQNYEDLYKSIREITKPEKPLLSDDKVKLKVRRVLNYRIPPLKTESEILLEFESARSSKDQPSFRVHQGPADTLAPCPPNTTPTTGCTKATNQSPHRQQSPGIHFPPISETVQLSHSQSQFERLPLPPILERVRTHSRPLPPQTPHIIGRTDLKQSSSQKGFQYLKQDESKHGRLLRIQQRGELKDSILTPCPPNTARTTGSTNAATKDTSKDVHFPPISKTGQLTHGQSQLKPHPPLTRRIRGGKGLEEIAPLTASPRRRVLNPQQRDTLKDSVLPPCPPIKLPLIKTSPQKQPVARTVRQGSEKTSQRERLPQISDKIQLTAKRVSHSKYE